VPDELDSVDDHLERILGAVRPLPVIQHQLMDAVGLACAEDVVSSLSLPRFDNSAMDGYAVRVGDVAGATESAPVLLPVVGEIGAGQASLRILKAGAAAKIMTGAPVPDGADAVVPYEWTDRGADKVRITRAPEPRQHIRPAGEDVRSGDLLIRRGTVLGPRHLGLLASVGRSAVGARPRPRVVIMSTGTELRVPGTPLDHDAIYDGNSYLLAAAAQRAGVIAHRVGIVGDDRHAFLETLYDKVALADVVVTSGGVSQGDFDVVKEALRPLETVWFGGVAMQPGKPQGFGLIGDVPIFTLPGNPVSSYVSFEIFVRPALRRMMGLEPAVEPRLTARLTEPVRSPEGRRQYRRGHHVAGDGTVAPVGGAGSHLVADLAAANVLIEVPDAVTALDAGTEVSVIPLDRGL
jgi:molybdopterin molybdotransferase